MFRVRQPRFLPSMCAVPLSRRVKLADGKVIIESSFERPALPPVENFRLQALLDAGVSLQEVSTVLVDSSSVDLPLEKSPEKSSEKSPEKSSEKSST